MDTFNKYAEAIPTVLKTVAGLLHDTDHLIGPAVVAPCSRDRRRAPKTEMGIISGLLRRHVKFDRGLLCSYTFPLTTRLGNLVS